MTAQHANVFQQLLLARRFHKEIDTALALDGHDAQALRDLMEFYLLAPGVAGGDIAKANATAERIAAIDAAEGYLARARLAEFHHQNGRIQDLLEHAAAAEPPSYRARIALAEFALKPEHADLALAEAQARSALALDRGRVEAYALLAEVYATREQWSELDAVLAEAGRNVPDDAAPWYRAAERLRISGRDLPRAVRYFRTYLGQPPEGNQPSWAEAHWKLGLVLDRQGQRAQAVAEWNQAVRLDAASPARRELKRTQDTAAGR